MHAAARHTLAWAACSLATAGLMAAFLLLTLPVAVYYDLLNWATKRGKGRGLTAQKDDRLLDAF